MFGIAKREQPTTAADDLQSVLLELYRYGQPRIGVYGAGRGWHCNIEMTTTSDGVDFKVSSGDFTSPDPLTAALKCRENLRKALVATGGMRS